MRILYFLEDIAHQRFITSLVKRIAADESLTGKKIHHEIRTARHGSRAVGEFKKFIKDESKKEKTDVDLLIVAVDGNRKGYSERRKQLDKYIKSGHPYKDRVVYAIPDPHIERWYILDQKAFKEGVGLDKAPALPPYKRAKDYYKNFMRKALREGSINSLLGGAEFAEKIVDGIHDINSLCNNDKSFKSFVDDLRSFLKTKKK